MANDRDGNYVPTWTMGDRLRKARILTEKTVAEFSRLTLISEKTINNYEGDKVVPQPVTIDKWAQVAGVSREWLWTGVALPAGTPAPEMPWPLTEQEQEARYGIAQLLREKRAVGGGRFFIVSDTQERPRQESNLRPRD